MTKLLISYQNDVKALASQGNSNKDKLQTLLTKKKLVEKEVIIGLWKTFTNSE